MVLEPRALRWVTQAERDLNHVVTHFAVTVTLGSRET